MQKRVVNLPNEIIKLIRPEFSDKRGIIANILEKPICHVAIITSKKGSVRANHYHPKQFQYVYLISGKYESISKSLKAKNAKKQKIVVKPGNLVITPPMIAHAMRFLQDSIMLNLTTGQRYNRNFERHTKKYKLV